MRHDASSDFPRHWVLQASGDGAAWTDLSVHRADCSLRKPGQYASWPVLGPSAQTAYRLFRLRLTGPTTNPHQAYAFPLAYWEISSSH
ncbi:methyltransf_FA domain-containing protein, partial [Haematococcus lacustris]